MQKKPNVSAKKLMLKKETLTKLNSVDLSLIKGANGSRGCNTHFTKCTITCK